MTRSSEANRRLWALYHALAEQVRTHDKTYSADQWHLYCKSRFLGCDDFTMPNGKTMTIPKSTADLDVGAFGDYMTAVEAWANERGIFLEDMEGAA
jgi:hypothetical protein